MEPQQVLRERGRAFRPLLRDNDSFRSLLTATATSGLGDWIGLFAILQLAEQLEGATRAGAFALGAIMVARIIPTLVLGPVAGVFVDRWDRKRTMIATDVVRGVVMALLAFAGDAFQLIVATFVIEVASALFIPAKDAVLPTIVRPDRIVKANQLTLIVTYGTLPFGALFLTTFQIPQVTFGPFVDRPLMFPIFLNALSFAVSAVIISRMDVPDAVRARRERALAQDAPSEPGAWDQLMDGFRFVLSEPQIRAVMIGVMAALMAAGVVVGAGPLYVRILGGGGVGFPLLAFVIGVGLVLGLGASGVLTSRWATEQLFAPGIAAAGGALTLAALAPGFVWAVPLAGIIGLGSGVAFISAYTLVQQQAEDEVRGRTFASFNTAVRAALFAGLVFGPVLIGIIGVEQPVEGPEVSVEDLESLDGDDPEPVYGYTVGGVRITLALAGLIGLAGAVWTGRAVHTVLSVRRREEEDAQEARDAERSRPPALDVPSSSEHHAGLFVVFEGGDGSGKSTQLRMLAEAMRADGHDVVEAREPGGTPAAEQVRRIVLDPGLDVAPRAEALLYAAARAQLADEVLRPALGKGALVLCDRFVDSSVAYQGVGRELGEEAVAELNRWGTAGLAPDLVVLLDVDLGEAQRRQDGAPDRLEAAGEEFHREVNAAFRRLARQHPGRYLVLDAGGSRGSLHDRIVAEVRARLEAPEQEAPEREAPDSEDSEDEAPEDDP